MKEPAQLKAEILPKLRYKRIWIDGNTHIIISEGGEICYYDDLDFDRDPFETSFVLIKKKDIKSVN